MMGDQKSYDPMWDPQSGQEWWTLLQFKPVNNFLTKKLF